MHLNKTPKPFAVNKPPAAICHTQGGQFEYPESVVSVCVCILLEADTCGRQIRVKISSLGLQLSDYLGHPKTVAFFN